MKEEEKNKTKLDLKEIESWGMAHEFENFDQYIESNKPNKIPKEIKQITEEWKTKNNKFKAESFKKGGFMQDFHKAYFEKMSRYKRAGKNGKVIQCPYCLSQSRVYHLRWAALKCEGCKRVIDKYKYKIEKSKNSN